MTLPSRVIVPESGWSTPVKTFIRVDFPAPFSPTRQRISPRLSVRLTLSSACTPGKALLMPSITRIFWSESDMPAYLYEQTYLPLMTPQNPVAHLLYEIGKRCTAPLIASQSVSTCL